MVYGQEELDRRRNDKMMRKAGRHHAVRGAAVAASCCQLATFNVLTIRDRVEDRRKATYAAGLVQSLLSADTAQVPAIIVDMAEYRHWTDPLLREESDKAGGISRQKLHASLALLPVDSTKSITFMSGCSTPSPMKCR